MEKLTLYKKLALIQSSIRGLGQDKKGSNYEYVSGSKVLAAIKPLMIEYGLLLKQEIVEIQNQRQDYIVGSNGKERQKSEVLTSLRMKFTWIDTETGEKDENLFAANGQNDWDKGVGSALTYGERYFLLKFFHIATDEDDCDAPKDILENFEPMPTELEYEIRTASTVEQLNAIYMREQSNFKDASMLIEMCANRKRELSNENI